MNTALSPGELVFYPGRPLPSIASHRKALAGLLLRGQPAHMAGVRLPQLYALCGQSHRITASLAIDAALGLRSGATPEECDSLRLETAREHVRRIWLDWPRWLGGVDGAAHMRHLLACPWLSPAQAGDALAWLEDSVLQGPARAWLACWQRDPAGWLGDWAARTDSLPAQLLRAVECEAALLPCGAPPLLVHGDVAALRRLARALAGDAGFAQLPVCDGQVRETGVASRLAHAWRAAPSTLWLRLGSRIAELAELALAGHGEAASPLALGALDLGQGCALAWSEMARGLLLHWVRLEQRDGKAVIGDYRVVAPTEWNFHPRGAVAQSLAGMAPVANARDWRQLGILAAAYDPCINFRIEYEHA
ncbi:MAG: nickel-dependent hydrogenase large subunit [Janthinobacterium sp.]